MSHKQWAGVLIAAFAGVALAALTGLAIAKTFALGVVNNGTVTNAKRVKSHEPLVVDAHGSAVYDLLHETTHHALCTKKNGCFALWFPVKVASARTKLTVAAGIKGKLGIWHRDGFYQLTLGGHPLYTFKGDGRKKGVATGEGIKSFRGTWSVIRGPGKSGPTTTTSSTTRVPTTTTSSTTMPTTTTTTMPTTTTSTTTTTTMPSTTTSTTTTTTTSTTSTTSSCADRPAYCF